jgi:molybdopterin-guanine dinucleotide biosynthesis protein
VAAGASASFSVVCTDEKWAMHQHGPLDEMALRSHAQTDVLLLEGFKKSNHPKVICVHPENICSIRREKTARANWLQAPRFL